MALTSEATPERRIEALFERGEERGCVNLSELAELAQELELPEDDAQNVHDRLEARGIEVADDCGNGTQTLAHYNNEELAVMTSDTLQLFLRDVRRHPLLSADEEVELAQRIERGDLDAKERMVNSNLRLVVSLAKKYQGHELALLDLIQEGILGPDPRGREVRLAQGLQVLDLRDLLDPPGDPARTGQPGPHDPHPGAYRAARAQDRAGRARAGRASTAARPPTRRSPPAPRSPSTSCWRRAR